MEADLKRLVVAFIMVVSLLSYWGCASLPRGASAEDGAEYAITDVSAGLPSAGLWRQQLSLVDMDGDGFLDIAAPPPRKAEKDQVRPFIFVRGKDGKWREGNYTFPKEVTYDYGGIATGDLNGDGYPDIVLAAHTRDISILENNKGGGFTVKAFPVGKEFHSRAVEIADVNGDKLPDIVAVSEAAFKPSYKQGGILIGINKGGNEWEVQSVEESMGIQADSVAVGDIDGDGSKDIAIAEFAVKEGKKIIWFGDGKGNYKAYEKDIAEKLVPFLVRLGDLDGDGKDEVVLKVSTIGSAAVLKLSVLKWSGDGFKDISSGLENVESMAFDLADLDGDGKKEIVVLSKSAILIYKYLDARWVELGRYPVSSKDSEGAKDMRAGRNRDGSFLIVFNLGDEDPSLNQGIKAFNIKGKLK